MKTRGVQEDKQTEVSCSKCGELLCKLAANEQIAIRGRSVSFDHTIQRRETHCKCGKNTISVIVAVRTGE